MTSKNKSDNKPNHHSDIDFPVVGIGASAGGLDAYKLFLKNIPEKSGMAYVLVQHLAPGHASILPEILTRETKLPVYEITDNINIEPDSIYIIPENQTLTVFDGKLKLTPRDKATKINMPIDIFFESLAEVYAGFARGVILSGTGFDGTLGLKAIKEAGGVTFVQNPDSAAFEGMPLSAIRAGAADFVLDVKQIPAQLQYIESAYENSHAYAQEDHLVGKDDDDFFKHILRILRLRTGNDFSHYKQPTIRRRIARRMVVTQKENPLDYLNFVRNDKTEQDALFNDILIPVSYFFRDTKTFELFFETVFPAILKKKNSIKDTIRVWVAGCSTGEEAYSIAIGLHEFLADKTPDIKVQLFATDISENVIAKARAGIYGRQEIQNVSETRLKNYFTKIEGAYHINKEIREVCVFAVHSFIKDPPFAKMDVISCRNVLIYLDPFLQKKALNAFHYGLKPHGFLFLGKSETTNQVVNLFEPILKNHKIFARKNTVDTFLPMPPDRFDPPANKEQQIEQFNKNIIEKSFLKSANELLFSKYTPAGVVINEHKEIVHFHGDTSPFLLQPPGKPNFNILKIIRDSIAFELRTALLKVKTDKESVLRENIHLKGKDYLLNLEIIPLENKIEEGHLLILFHKTTPVKNVEGEGGAAQRKTLQSERIKQLEAEIEQMRDDIRKVTEDQEVANEELQSANEELLSNSEELQTLNEELETSAEELQSNNEELISVNDELMDQHEQLTNARLYSEAIVETIREPLVVLNKELRVKSANASFYRFFKTTEQNTEGKLIFDLTQVQWDISALKAHLLKIIPERILVEGFEVNVTLPEIGKRVMLLNIFPILKDQLSEPLILIAIEDITEIRSANVMLQFNNKQLKESNKELSSYCYIASHDMQEPLRKIHSFGKLILDDKNSTLSGEANKYMERIVVSIQRMQQLTDDLLNYSNVSNAVEEDFENTDLKLLLADVLEELKEIIQAKNAIIKVSELPVLKALPLLMRQLFINLLSNALKYSKQNTVPRISISLSIVRNSEIKGYSEHNQHSEHSEHSEHSAKNYYRIKVTDNGIGFPEEQALKIFEPFKRLHAKDKYEGTGIGLAICKKIASKHKGFITANSILDQGATFNLYLPVS